MLHSLPPDLEIKNHALKAAIRKNAANSCNINLGHSKFLRTLNLSNDIDYLVEEVNEKQYFVTT